MYRKLGNLLFSMTTAVTLMSVFAVSIAWATFIENDFGTDTAKKLVYSADWFSVLLLLIMVNITGNVFKYKLFTRKKWTILLFHLAFVLIIAGGGITRYAGFEGSMHIREGASSNLITLNRTFLTMDASVNDVTVKSSKKIALTQAGSNRYNLSATVAGQKVRMETMLFVPNATESVIESENGEPAIALFIMDGQRAGHEVQLMWNDQTAIDNVAYSLGENNIQGVNFSQSNGLPVFIAMDTVIVNDMMTRDTILLLPGIAHNLTERTIYRMGNQLFVLRGFWVSAEKSFIIDEQKETGMQGLVANLTVGNQQKRVNMMSRNGEPQPVNVRLGDVDVTVSFGRKTVNTPFSVELKDFILERYPGSNSPSSYASEVVVHDDDHAYSFPYRIFMNHTLKYRGYRFFQSSYDTDEGGTILSVSHDYWGTFVTYFGYLLMTLGMVLSLLNKNSRFRTLLRQSGNMGKLKKAGVAMFLLITISVSGQAQDKRATNKQHYNELNSLLVQDFNGRIEPYITMASDVMRKLYKKEQYKGIAAPVAVLGMQFDPVKWQQEPIIKISNSVLAREMGAPTGYISYRDMFINGQYKLQKLVSETYQKDPNKRNKYDKEVLNLDERMNISYQIYTGNFLKILPLKCDTSHRWATLESYVDQSADSVGVNPAKLYEYYLMLLSQGKATTDTETVVGALRAFKKFQREIGGEIVPSNLRISLEVFYTRANIFGRLFKLFFLVGFLMLISSLVRLFRPATVLRGADTAGFAASVLLFVVYTSGIVVRWIISGHAPWSNGYETMVFIGWATILAGLLFARKSPITLAVTNVLAGIVLLVAGFSWMNPEITPLVPVLKSYWLIVHVAVITSSYGFLGIGALLAFLNLLLYLTAKRNETIGTQIRELTTIIELTLIVGLVLLTTGSFIGGVWANESWGRYWGWDPKETWALVTILVYSVVLHLRKIPGGSSIVLFNSLSLLSFSSVLMTFFGVNYYLSGLHSYAQGDAPPIPVGVYIALALVLLVVTAAFIAERMRGQEKS